MSYVDGFLLPVHKKNLAAYKKMARQGKKMWLQAGALDYKECVGDDLTPQWALPFPKQMKLKKGELPVFSFIIYKNRKHRDAVNKKVMANMNPDAYKDMPFDMKRMAYGGFTVLVE